MLATQLWFEDECCEFRVVVVFVVVMMMMLRQHETETKSGAGQRELARKGVKWLGMNVCVY